MDSKKSNKTQYYNNYNGKWIVKNDDTGKIIKQNTYHSNYIKDGYTKKK